MESSTYATLPRLVMVSTGMASKTLRQRELPSRAGKARPAVRTKSISGREIVRYLKSAPKIDAKRFRKDVDSLFG
jgi:hypothetical protein